jgi:hypothetical protein
MAASFASMMQQMTPKVTVDVLRFSFTISNFIMTAIFAIVLLIQAFNMDSITQNQIFHADRILQTSGLHNLPPATLSTFIKTAYGAETEILGVVDETTELASMLPTMYEIAGGNSILRLEAVHCNFMLFSALWIASAFALTMLQFPFFEPLYWSHVRVVIVHVWNLCGLIATCVIFTATTRWASIPTSNLFYALVGQVMGWMYQYFHMVECTQIVNGNLKLEYKTVHGLESEEMLKSTQFSTELRKIIYMEFSVVAPMLFVAGIMPGSVGIDEWRIQTVLFSSWALFALLGLHLRFRKSLESAHLSDSTEMDKPDEHYRHNLGKHRKSKIGMDHGLDALGYLTYAIIVVYVMLTNAVEPYIFYSSPWATQNVAECRAGIQVLFCVCGLFVLETMAKTVQMRFKPGIVKAKFDSIPELFVSAFAGNMFFLVAGSFVVKIFLFLGISDVNALSRWVE